MTYSLILCLIIFKSWTINDVIIMQIWTFNVCFLKNARLIIVKSTSMLKHFFLNFAIFENAIFAFAWFYLLKSYFIFNFEFESIEKCFMNDFKIEKIATILFLITIVMFAKNFKMFVENFLISAENFYKFLIFAKNFCRFLSFLMIINVMNF